MNAANIQILLFPRHSTSWVKFVELARILSKRDEVQVTLVQLNGKFSGFADKCTDEGLTIRDLSIELETAVQARCGSVQALVDWFIRKLGHLDRVVNAMPISILRFVEMRRRLKAEYDVFRRELERAQADVVVIPGDREMTPIPGLIKAARDLGLPCVIGASSSPYPEGVALSRAGYPRFALSIKSWPPLLNFLAALLFPKQALNSRHGPMLFSPAWLIFAHASLGMLSENPWVQGGGLSTHSLQHSRRRMEGFVNLGVSEDKLVPIGDQALDLLYDGHRVRDDLRRQIWQTFSFEPNKPLIVVAVPNDAEHDVCDMESHILRMSDYFRVLGRAAANVLLCLHPKSDPASYAPLAENHGLSISSKRLVDILPAGDLFVCSGSSTVLWAQLCAIPTINLDYWQARDADFQDVVGIENVETPDQFETSLRQFLSKRAENQVLADHSKQMRVDCFFDGKAGQRIGDFLIALARPMTAASSHCRSDEFSCATRHT